MTSVLWVLPAWVEEEPQEESGSLLDSLHSHGEWISREVGLEKLMNLKEQETKVCPLS